MRTTLVRAPTDKLALRGSQSRSEPLYPDGRRERRPRQSLSHSHKTPKTHKVTLMDKRCTRDTLGRVSGTVFLGSMGDSPVLLSATSYDAAGRVYQSTDANQNTTTNVYDGAGRRVAMIDALGYRTRYSYDAAGNLRPFTDGKGRTTEHVYDVLNCRTPAALDVNGDGVIGSGKRASLRIPIQRATNSGGEWRRQTRMASASGSSTRSSRKCRTHWLALGRLREQLIWPV
jgi:YD repeat-containing protein